MRKKIACVDVPESFVKLVLRFVENRYDFEFTTGTDANYVFHSVGGMDILKYSGVRIFVTGENVTPNFAISDYAMSFDKIDFGDRSIWLPLIKLSTESYASLIRPRRCVEEIYLQKSDFCAYVMSNTSSSDDARTRIFDLLNEYKQVNSGGRWKNNVGGLVADKLKFQSKHKFVIAFENCSYPGYLTEKFADAAAANAIPIYWGDPEIGNLFNEKAFINCHTFPSLESVVEKVREIDQNEKLYRQMLSEPSFPDGIEPECLRDETIAKFLSNILDQKPEQAFRRNRGRWGLKKEKALYDMYFRPHAQAFVRLRHYWRKMWRVLISRSKKA